MNSSSKNSATSFIKLMLFRNIDLKPILDEIMKWVHPISCVVVNNAFQESNHSINICESPLDERFIRFISWIQIPQNSVHFLDSKPSWGN